MNIIQLEQVMTVTMVV